MLQHNRFYPPSPSPLHRSENHVFPRNVNKPEVLFLLQENSIKKNKTMKLKQLEMLLQSVAGFREPKLKHEQYETGHHIGARMLFTMANAGDIEGKAVLDLGIGCGRLGIAASHLGAAYVLGVDIDPDALAQCQENIQAIREEEEEEDEDEEMLTNIDLLCADVSDDSGGLWDRLSSSAFQVVIMNPPFGTKAGNKGLDAVFLRRALAVASETVYSLHKTSTREYILRKAKEWGARRAEVVAQLRYDLPATYSFHRRASKDIEVDFYRFEK